MFSGNGGAGTGGSGPSAIDGAVDAIVVDIGHDTAKVGFAGSDMPKYLSDPYLGVYTDSKSNKKVYEESSQVDMRFTRASRDRKEEDSTAETSDAGATSSHVGQLPKDYHLENPFQEGCSYMSNWDAVQSLLEHATTDALSTKASEHPFLVAEPSIDRRSGNGSSNDMNADGSGSNNDDSQSLGNDRENLVELLFESLEVPATFLAKSVTLSCFANGRATGLVIDMGASRSTVVPVHEGYALDHAMYASPVAGDYLSAMLEYRMNMAKVHHFGTSPNRTPDQPIVVGRLERLKQVQQQLDPGTADRLMFRSRANVGQDMKETLCRVSDATFIEMENLTIPRVVYELPDGTSVSVGPERFITPEMLFSDVVPSNGAGPDGKGQKGAFMSLQGMVTHSIHSCEMDIRRDLWHNIILGGGGSMLDSLPQRLEKELSGIVSLGVSNIPAADPSDRLVPTLPQPQALYDMVVKAYGKMNLNGARGFDKGTSTDGLSGDLTTMVPAGMNPNKIKVIAAQANERRISAWLGGSILGSLSSFHEMWISKQEYHEIGPSIIDRKCP